MSEQESLRAAMREALDSAGTIAHVKSELRAAIYQSLADVTQGGDDGGGATAPGQGRSGGSGGGGVARADPPAPPENLILNELIKEYLAFNGLEHTLACFQLEARVADGQVPRRALAAQLNLAGAPASVPLLYAMLHEARLSRDLE